MSKLTDIKNNVGSKIAKAGVKVAKKSPDILVALGIVGVIGATVMACRATKKSTDILDKHDKKVAEIKRKKVVVNEETGEETNAALTEEETKAIDRDILKTKAETAFELGKTYAPAVGLGAVSIACIWKGYDILNKRNLALGATVSGLTREFKEYRKRVESDKGSEADISYRFNKREEEVTVTDEKEDGEKVETRATKTVVDPVDKYSIYARYFDSSNPNYRKDPFYNLTFLRGCQTELNARLNSEGFVFLNDAYDLLGFPKTPAGQVTGWIKGNGDDYIDLGIYDGDSWATRDFVNGYEPVILLDFNVDGSIWDKI